MRLSCLFLSVVCCKIRKRQTSIERSTSKGSFNAGTCAKYVNEGDARTVGDHDTCGGGEPRAPPPRPLRSYKFISRIRFRGFSMARASVRAPRARRRPPRVRAGAAPTQNTPSAPLVYPLVCARGLSCVYYKLILISGHAERGRGHGRRAGQRPAEAQPAARQQAARTPQHTARCIVLSCPRPQAHARAAPQLSWS